MKTSIVICSLSLAALTAACAPKPATAPPLDVGAVRTALAAQLAKFPAAIQSKDTAAVADLFTPDATWILPDASTYVGRAAITSGAQAFFNSITGTMSYPPVTIDNLVVVNDSEAVTFSHGNYTLTEPGKQPVSRVNPFADLWKKGADGTWRIAYEVNADGPAPTPGK